jgi:predicted ThiF/HesA family dinucleotide-utilizing enzyme
MIKAQRNLDNLQIELGEDWRRWLTIACLGCSLTFGWIVVALVNHLSQDNLSAGEILATILVITIAGALTAPIAHDLTRAIRSFRGS